MAQAYFTLPSFARAKQHRVDLAKTNPQTPVLRDEDEKFLEKITSNEEPADSVADLTQSEIADNGDQTDLGKTEIDEQLVIPSTQPDGSADDPPESVPERHDFARGGPPRTKKTRKDAFEGMPSQEEAEAATRGFAAGTQSTSEPDNDKKTWTSYVPSLNFNKKSPTSDGEQKSASEQSPQSGKDDRTWAEYASKYVPSTIPTMSTTIPLMPKIPSMWSKSKDAKPDQVLNEDGTVNEEATKEKQEKEVSVLLDNLDLSSINNRVFAFSKESQKLYERFIQVLKDVMNGVPTAYEDMEKFLKDAGPTIEKQWNSMPPFIQTLVKSLPAKLSATLAPELLAATSMKPGYDAKQMDAAQQSGATGGAKSSKKKKRYFRIPGLKGLVKKQGLAATILRNISVFLKTRFPLLAGMTNVGMSLSVFGRC